MDSISAHLTANAALASRDMLVLDPFCGTGSLIIACASLGADVVGADIDGECLGLAPDPTALPYLQRSKNVRFRRKGHVSQMEENILSNFRFYGLEDRLAARLAADAGRWLEKDLEIPWEQSFRNLDRLSSKLPQVRNSCFQ